MSLLTNPPGIVEIAYDDTPTPSALALADAARELELPDLDWRVVRRLRGRIVALGYRPDADAPDWVMKIGTGPESVAFLRHGAEWATRLAAFTTNQSLLVGPDAANWRLVVDAAQTRGLLAAPFVSGIPLAPESKLDLAGAAALANEIPAILAVMTTLEQLPYAPTRPRLKEWASYLRRRFERHVAAIVATSQISEARGEELRSAFRHHLGLASSVFRLAHGELTPWHLLRTPDGRLALLDLDTMGYEVRHIDLSVLVMRIWALQDCPVVAKQLFEAYLAQLTPRDREAFGRTTAWQWLFAGARTLHEAQSWPQDQPARDFLTWCQAQV